MDNSVGSLDAPTAPHHPHCVSKNPSDPGWPAARRTATPIGTPAACCGAGTGRTCPHPCSPAACTITAACDPRGGGGPGLGTGRAHSDVRSHGRCVRRTRSHGRACSKHAIERLTSTVLRPGTGTEPNALRRQHPSGSRPCPVPRRCGAESGRQLSHGKTDWAASNASGRLRLTSFWSLRDRLEM